MAPTLESVAGEAGGSGGSGGVARSTTTSKRATTAAIAPTAARMGASTTPDGRHRQRNLHESMASLVLDNDAAHIAFMNQFPDLVGEFVSGDFELLEHLAEFVHDRSVARRERGIGRQATTSRYRA